MTGSHTRPEMSVSIWLDGGKYAHRGLHHIPRKGDVLQMHAAGTDQDFVLANVVDVLWVLNEGRNEDVVIYTETREPPTEAE